MRSIKTNLALALLCGSALAQTPLTTIQDTLFKADGARFNGSLTIHWNTFDSSNVGLVVQQSRTVQVTNGNLQVQLAPNAGAPTPANVYTVQYQGDGREQFAETWTIPISTRMLKVADVRTGTLSNSPGGTSGALTPIPESNVIGLLGDLGQRPVKGPGFGTGSVAVINPSGQIETVVGNIGDCVMVDGTTGPCGTPAPTFVDAETPGGLVDGSNLTFTLTNAPLGSSLMLFRNGLYMKAGQDYTLTGSTVLFASQVPPQPLDTLVASYRFDATVGAIQLPGSPQPLTLAQVVCSASGHETRSASQVSLGTCDIPAASLRSGDRFEIRFDFTHTGTASAFDLEVKWGTVSIVARHGSTRDSALSGHAEASVGTAGTQIGVQSWGNVLGFLPGIITSPQQNGLKIDLRGQLSNAGSDKLALSNFTVLRYPSR